MTYIILALALVGLLVVTLRLNDFNLFAPSSLFVLVFVGVVILDIIGLASWNSVSLSWRTAAIILVSCVSFVIGSTLPGICRPSSKTQILANKQKMVIDDLYRYSIKQWQFLLIYIVIAIAAYVKIQEIFKISGLSNLPKAIALVRYKTSAIFSASGDGSVHFSFIVSQSDKLVNVIGLIMVFELLTCIRGKKGIAYSISCCVAFLSACAYSLLSGGRGTALGLCISFIFAWQLLDMREKKNKLRSSLFLIKISALALIILLPLFYIGSRLVGRQSRGNMIDYISFYFGAGIPSFEYRLQHLTSFVPANKDFPFINTFYGFYQVLHKFGVVGTLPPYGNEWVTLGQYKSNIFTCFYRYYADFGLFGCIVLSCLAGLIYTAIYRLSSNSVAVWTIPLWISVARTLVDVGRDETLFSHQIFTLSFWVTSVLIFLVSWFLYGKLGIQTTKSYSVRQEEKNFESVGSESIKPGKTTSKDIRKLEHDTVIDKHD